MKRNEIVEKLIGEGISEKTLSKLSDKQINDLSERMLGETLTTTVDALKKSPALQAAAKDPNQKIQVVGEEKPSAGLSKEKKSEVAKKAKKGEDIGKKGKGFEKLAKKAAKEYGSKEKGEKVAAAAMWKNIKRESVEEKKWIENLAEEKFFHILTSKDEIMEMITSKVKPQKKMSSLPDSLKWDSLKALSTKQSEVAENGTTTKPAPTKPKIDPGTKPKHPLNPGIFPKPKPKAGVETKIEENNTTTKPAPTKPKINPDTKPKKHPLNPGVFPKPKRKA